MLGHHAVERFDVLQGAPHQHGIRDALTVIGEDPNPSSGLSHRPEFGELAATESHRDGTNRVDIAKASAPPQVPHLLYDTSGVGDRVGVGHRMDRGEATNSRGRRSGGNSLGVLAAGFSQMRMQIDQAWECNEPEGIDHLGIGVCPRRGVGPYCSNESVSEEDVLSFAAEDAGAFDQEARLRTIARHCAPPSAESLPPSKR
jgi:hypothetical protein